MTDAVEGAARLAELERRAAAFDPTRGWVRGDGSGTPLSDRVWRGGQDVRQQIDDLLVEAIRTGEDALQTATKLEQYLDPAYSPRRDAKGRLVRNQPKGIVTAAPGRSGMGSFPARRLARTEVTRAHGQATIDSAQLDPFVLGLKWNRSGRHPEEDECDEHATADVGLGEGVYPPDEVPRYPAHPMCFPAGTVVGGPPAVASTARWYAGDVVDLRLAGGNLLTVTPNHPILTPEGWVAAGALHEGDDVVCCALPEWEAAGVGPDHHDGAALIEDVAVALGGAASVPAVPVPTAAEDFHGDGAGSEVHVVRADRLLRHGNDAPIGKPAGEQDFGGRNTALPLLTGRGDPAPTLERVRRAATGSMGGFGPTAFLLGGDLAHGQADALDHAAPLDPGQLDAPGDDVAAYPVGDRQRLLGLPRHVAGDDLGVREGEPGAAGFRPFLDRVRCTQVRHFSGHVYNLQTVSGWYIANGIIVHNCLCVLTKEVNEDTDAVVDALRQEYGLDQPRMPEEEAFRQRVERRFAEAMGEFGEGAEAVVEAAAPAGFTPARTIKEAKQASKDLGLDVTKATKDDLDVLNSINEAVTRMKAAGQEPPTRWIIDRGDYDWTFGGTATTADAQAMAVFDPNPGWRAVVLNRRHPYYGRVARQQSDLAAQGWLSSADPLHIYYHEAAHGMHYRLNPFTFNGTEREWESWRRAQAVPRALSGVSRYAATDKLEFVAEVYAGRMGGKTYSEAVMELFENLGGMDL